ncbi:MAG: ligase-associated DNA damage response endonuclease PdeM [Flammeovirgaceae bacterium]
MNLHQFHELFKQQICLLPEKCLFWPAKGMLIIADVHLGKVMHFRKAGIPVPTALIKRDLTALKKVILDWNPSRVIFLGDLFHSHLNAEWHLFEAFLEQFPTCSFELVLGNHDAYSADFMQAKLSVYQEHLVIDPFVFTHIPLELHEIPEGAYNLSGHVHPSVKLVGQGRQQLQLPCFYFGEKQGILPAFGAFTGFVPIQVGKGDTVFPIAEGRVMQV